MFTTFSSVLATALALAPVALSAVIPGVSMDERYLARRALNVGLGTRYGDGCTEEDCWQGGACAFTDYTLPSSVDGSTCVSEDIWDSSAQCGGCISVTYQGKTLIVMVTNKTGGGKNHLDMTPDTWAKLTNGDTGGGVNGIEWEFVTCPIPESTPLHVHAHGGSSQYWPAITIENARRRTQSAAFSDDQGKTWVASKRDTNNFFVAASSLSSNTVWVKLTSHIGTTVVVKNVDLASGTVTIAAGNYA